MKNLNDKNVAKLILPDKFRSNKPGYLLDLFKLDKELVDKIISKSKMNNIRLSGYFHTVTLYALRRLFIENDEPFPSSVPISFPVNLRFRLEPPVDLSACRFFTAPCECSTEREKFGKYENFWEDAKYVHDKIQEHSNPETGNIFNLTHEKSLEVFNQICRLTGTSKKTLKLINFLHPTNCDLCVSNLGRFVSDSYKEFDGKFSIHEIYCSDLLTSIPRISSSIIMHIIFWRGEIMFQTGANNYYFDEKYFKRLSELILLVINETLV
ncbi:unnamed protein product [Brachionus calyciflorus]|uniref:Uncharacterized protein n=1 Tax=Brachionus calyciflorus TaxID=104777 RepID=A0A814R9A7_9BILA|nr:unnamed protein product [Brachionus calyciflorus]